jgi:hypothetical protein
MGPPNGKRLAETEDTVSLGAVPMCTDATNKRYGDSAIVQDSDNVTIGGVFIAVPGSTKPVLTVVRDTGAASENGEQMNVGPDNADSGVFTRDRAAPMVRLADSGVLQANTSLMSQLALGFSGDYQGLMGHGDIHFYDRLNGSSAYCHFSIRFSTENASAVTLDFGDTSGPTPLFAPADSGTAIRIFVDQSAGPNYNPRLIIKNGYGTDVDVSYDIRLRKLVYP